MAILPIYSRYAANFNMKANLTRIGFDPRNSKDKFSKLKLVVRCCIYLTASTGKYFEIIFQEAKSPVQM